MDSIKEFFDNLIKKLRKVFTDKGIVAGGYRISYRIIPIVLVVLLIIILLFSLIGRALKGGKNNTGETGGDSQTQVEITPDGDGADTEAQTGADTQEPAEDPGNTENDGENYYAVMNGSKRVGLFETEADAKALLTSIKAEFVDINDRSAMVTIEPELTIEKVAQNTVTEGDLTKDSKALVNELLYGSSEESTYVATADDTMWSIAVANGISLDELLAANPDIDPNAMHAGDVIRIKVGQGEVSVRAVYEEVKEEEIPYETVYEDSDDLYVGEEEVVTWGRKGRKVVTTKVVKVNGITVSDDEAEEEILEEAVTELIKRGTIGRDDSSDSTDSENSDNSDSDTDTDTDSSGTDASSTTDNEDNNTENSGDSENNSDSESTDGDSEE